MCFLQIVSITEEDFKMNRKRLALFCCIVIWMTFCLPFFHPVQALVSLNILNNEVNNVRVGWDLPDPDNPPASIDVKYRVGSGSDVLTTIGGTDTTFTISSIGAATAWSITVDIGDGSPATVSGTTPAAPPASPVVRTNATVDNVSIDWDNVPHCTFSVSIYPQGSTTAVFNSPSQNNLSITIPYASFSGTVAAGAQFTAVVTATDSSTSLTSTGSSNFTIPAPAAPSTPANFQSTNSVSQVNLKWTESTGATGYRVYRAESQAGSYNVIQTVGSSVTAVQDNNVVVGSTYWYKVCAFNAGGDSPQSAAISVTVTGNVTKPGKPAGIKLTVLSSTSIELTWARVTNADGYNIYRSTTGTGTFTLVGTVKEAKYVDTNLTAEKQYFYYVEAYKETMKSDPSDTVNGTTLKPQKPQTPKNLRAEDITENDMFICWSASNDAKEYRIFFSDKKDGPFQQIAQVTTLKHKVDKLKPNTEYFFKVQAFNEIGSSEMSEVLAVTTLGEREEVDIRLQVLAVTESSITLGWQEVEGTESYRIYRSMDSMVGFTRVGEVDSPALMWEDTNLESGVTYYYKVTAYDSDNGESNPSDVIAIKTEMGQGQDTSDEEPIPSDTRKISPVVIVIAVISLLAVAGAVFWIIYRNMKKKGLKGRGNGKKGTDAKSDRMPSSRQRPDQDRSSRPPVVAGRDNARQDRDRSRPERDRAEPGRERPRPGRDQAEPGRGRPRPDRDQAEPGRERPRPGRDQAEPGRDRPRPGRDQAEPGRDRSRPSRDQAGPGRERPRPDRERAEPGRERPRPDRDQAGSNRERPRPDREQTDQSRGRTRQPAPVGDAEQSQFDRRTMSDRPVDSMQEERTMISTRQPAPRAARAVTREIVLPSQESDSALNQTSMMSFDLTNAEWQESRNAVSRIDGRRPSASRQGTRPATMPDADRRSPGLTQTSRISSQGRTGDRSTPVPRVHRSDDSQSDHSMTSMGSFSASEKTLDRNRRFCSHCYAENVASSQYCHSCGATMDVKPQGIPMQDRKAGNR